MLSNNTQASCVYNRCGDLCGKACFIFCVFFVLSFFRSHLVQGMCCTNHEFFLGPTLLLYVPLSSSPPLPAPSLSLSPFWSQVSEAAVCGPGRRAARLPRRGGAVPAAAGACRLCRVLGGAAGPSGQQRSAAGRSDYPSARRRSVSRSVCQSASVCLSVCLSVCVRPSVCLSVCQSASQTVCLSVNLRLSVGRSICLGMG